MRIGHLNSGPITFKNIYNEITMQKGAAHNLPTIVFTHSNSNHSRTTLHVIKKRIAPIRLEIATWWFKCIMEYCIWIKTV